jgi:hypothetical protein
VEATGIDAESDAWLHLEDEWMFLIADANLAFVRTRGRGVGNAQREPCRSLGLLKRHLGLRDVCKLKVDGKRDFGLLREWHEPRELPRSAAKAQRLVCWAAGRHLEPQPSGGRRSAGSS